LANHHDPEQNAHETGLAEHRAIAAVERTPEGAATVIIPIAIA
jgi:hypothetical protein